MSVQLISKIRNRQPSKIVSLSSKYALKKPICAFIPGLSSVEIVRGINFVQQNSPSKGIIRGDKTLVSTSQGASYTGIRAPETTAGSRSDLFYDPGSPPLTLITVSTANQNEGGALMRQNGSGTPAFLSGAWYGSFSGGYFWVRTTGGTITTSPGVFNVDTRYVPVVNVVSIGVSTTQLWCGLIGGPCFQEYSVATPSGNFYYEYSDEYRVLSVGGGFSAFATNTILAAAFRSEFSRADALSIIANPWQIFEPETIPLFFSTVAVQLLSPTGDVAGGTWLPSAGTDLFACVDESTASDADYIYTTTPGAYQEFTFPDGGAVDPSTGGHVRYRIPAGTGTIVAVLKQGTTTLQTLGTHTLTGSAQDIDVTITASTSNSTDLRVGFTAM